MSDPSPDNDEAATGQPASLADGSGCNEPDCQAAVAELYGYLDGHLDDERRSLIKGHLDSCAPCFGAFDFEAELRTVIAAKCRDQVPAELRLKIQDALNQDALNQEG